MDIERGCIEILFKRIPYTEIGVSPLCKQQEIQHLTKSTFVKYAKEQFPTYSNDEIENLYSYIKDETQSEVTVFDYLEKISKQLLNNGINEPTCKFETLLRWRETSFKVGQDLLTCAFLAKHDIKHHINRNLFTWRPILRTDNNRLQNIMNKGIAENHFHINGSSQNFMLNWISIMNDITYDSKIIQQLDYRLSKKYDDTTKPQKVIGLQGRLMLAAYYRIYLYLSLIKETTLLNKLKKFHVIDKLEFPIVHLESFRNIIDICKYEFGYKTKHYEHILNTELINKEYVLDYCIFKKIGQINNTENRLLSGERYLLYGCLKNIYLKDASELEKLYFWRYLAIKTEFRSELVQVNGALGFDNFSKYQNRKSMFFEENRVLQNELLSLSVASTCKDQNIISLEGRGMWKNNMLATTRKLWNLSNEKLPEECDFFLVIHFPKQKDRSIQQHTCRNSKLRNSVVKKAKDIISYLDKRYYSTWKYNNSLIKIKGIDTCSNEIGCRPEVFAQAYRYLLGEGKIEIRHRISKYDYSNDLGKVSNYLDKNRPTICKPLYSTNSLDFDTLKATYHVGEDFLDIVDGLRAIDEVLLFCGYQRDFRIGHALALGVSPESFYKVKKYKLIISKQDALDNVVWLIMRSIELGVEIDNSLRDDLNSHFEEWICDLYTKSRNMKKEHHEITMCEYFNAWKLRGDNPNFYNRSTKDSYTEIKRNMLPGYHYYDLNPEVKDSVRNKHMHRELYHDYHYDMNVKQNGSKKVVFIIKENYIQHVRKLQDAMIHMLVKKGIGIECNPSSNYLIGTIDKYTDHPILRFQPIENCKPFPGKISASINTDDQGIFDTYLENEYALMASSLQKNYEKNPNVLYDIEDIYDWIENIRNLGIQQKF